MRPETQLAVMVAFIGFLLKTSLGFCICWAISKVLLSPRRKFLVWFGFLVGAGCYWLWLAVNFMPHWPAMTSLQVPSVLVSNAPVGKWQIQDSWTFPLSVLFRGSGTLYLLVLGYFLFARVRKHVHLRWILRFTYRAPEAIENIFRPIAETLDAGNVKLRMLSGIHSPATFGWVRPTVLLPPLCVEQDESELADIFRHELQHVQRRDYVFKSVASVCCALLFFCPAVWFALRRLELESELACDLAVIDDSPDRRATYAECLVRFARLNVTQEPSSWNLDFVGSSVQLKARIHSVLAETRRIPGWMIGLRATLGLLLFAGFLGIAPSLFIALSYEQHRIEQSSKPKWLNSPTDIRLRGIHPHETRLPRRTGRTSRAFSASSPTASITVPAEAFVTAAQIMPPRLEPAPSNESLPTLKRRGDSAAMPAPKSSPATVISLSNEPASHPESKLITRGRSIASAVVAGAGEAVAVGSHGRDKE